MRFNGLSSRGDSNGGRLARSGRLRLGVLLALVVPACSSTPTSTSIPEGSAEHTQSSSSALARGHRAAGPGLVRGNTFLLNNQLGTTSSVDVTVTYGNPGDVPIVGDWDGDGSKTPGVVRGNVWYLHNSTGPDITFTYGNVGDVPVVGDWDGNGTDTPGVVRGGYSWYLRNENSTGGGDIALTYGAPNGRPIVGDWDGNGTTTVGVVSGNTWYLRNENTSGAGEIVFGYGLPTDKLVVGDWDGNGTETVGVVRGNAWILQNENAAGTGDVPVFYFGMDSDTPVAGPWTQATVVQPEFSDWPGGWSNDIYGTTIRYGDVDGDGNTDVCGRGQAGIYCATFNGSYGFGPMRLWHGFFSDAGGWAPAYYGGTIQLADVNGDGKADVCGRSQAGVYCALSNGITFGPASAWESTFTDAAGWATTTRPISFGDVNGDGFADVCGRGYGGVVCGLSNGSSFSPSTPWDGIFTDAGWAPIAYSSSFQIADVNDDGMADVCERGISGFWCEMSRGNGFAYQTVKIVSDAFSDAGGWNLPQYASTIRVVPRIGSHDVRICGRGQQGVYCAEKVGYDPLTFSAISLQDNYFNDDSGWATRASYYQSIGFGSWKGGTLALTCGREIDGIACKSHPITTQYAEPTTLQLNYNGGPVLGTQTQVPIYLLFYGSWTADQAHYFINLSQHLGDTGLYGLLTEYKDSNGMGVRQGTRLAGTYYDNNYSHGKSLNDDPLNRDVQAILGAAMNSTDPSHPALPRDGQGVYMVLLAPDVVVPGADGAYCGYHKVSLVGAQKYGVVIGQTTTLSGCGLEWSKGGPTGTILDPMAEIFVHELAETITDPMPHSGYSGPDNENGDLCAWNAGRGVFTTPNGRNANLKVGDQYYLLQELPKVSYGNGYCSLGAPHTQDGKSIAIQSATYGANCGPSFVDLTSAFTPPCIGKGSCSLSLTPASVAGYVAPGGCTPELAVQYDCWQGPKMAKGRGPDQNQTIHLSCQ